MSANKITWEDKVALNPRKDRVNQWQDQDILELKTKFNANDDRIDALVSGYQGSLAIADTPTADGYYFASESGTYTNAGSLVVSLDNTLTFINVSDSQTVFTKVEIPMDVLGYSLVSNITTFNDLVTASTTGTWMILNDITLTANTTIPSDVTLSFNGGVINLGTYTLTGSETIIDGGIEQIFDTNGNINGDWTCSEIYPEWFGSIGDGVTDNYSSISFMLSVVPNIKGDIVFSASDYIIEAVADGAVLEGVSNTNWYFRKNSKITFKNTGAWDLSALLEHNAESNIKYFNIKLDGSSIVGANLIGMNNSNNIHISGADLRNVYRSATTGGGRALTAQFNCQDLLFTDITINDCTSGVDFHGRQGNRNYNIVVDGVNISNCEEAISIYDLFDGNNDLDIGGDSMCNITNVNIFNCGLATNDLTTGTATGEEGGVIVFEGSRSFSISDVTIYNESAYGKIGGVIRGTPANCSISNIKAYVECVAILNLSVAENLLPVVGNEFKNLETPYFNNIRNNGATDYVIYHEQDSGNKLYKAIFRNIQSKTPAVSLLNTHAGSSNSYAEIFSLNNGSRITGTLSEIYTNGNSFAGVKEYRSFEIIKQYNDLNLPLHSWENSRIILGGSYLWVSSGKLYINSTEPTNSTDGTIVGTQT